MKRNLSLGAALLVLWAVGCDDLSEAVDDGVFLVPADAASMIDAASVFDSTVDREVELIDTGPADAAPDEATDMNTPRPPPPPYDALEDCLAERIAMTPATGAAAAVVRDGAVVYAGGVGTRGPRDGRPVEATTLFRFASIVKGMTALAVLSEVGAGHLALDARVVDVVPELAANADPRWQALTVRHLMTHQGGLFNYLAFEREVWPESRLHDFLTSPEFARSAYFMVDPGTFYNYSNANYMLAGLVAETSAGMPYRQVMRERVFAPLGMTRVYFTADDVRTDGDYAIGVSENDAGVLYEHRPGAYDAVWAWPALLGWASAADLARYVQYIIDGEAPVVDGALWQAWRSPQVLAESTAGPAWYGYGLAILDHLPLGVTAHPTPVIFHDGFIFGYSSLLVTLPELGFGAVLLINTDLEQAALANCLVPLMASLDGLPAAVEPPPEWSPRAETFIDYVGEYEGTPNVGASHVELTEDGGLRISLPDLDRVGMPYTPELTPVGHDTFLLSLEGVPLLLTGLRTEGEAAIHYLRTRVFVGTRVEGAPKRARIDPDALRRALAQPPPGPSIWSALQ
ncbi:MAG: beta-lactamase family protein [Myxococcales bacterium]|nr:beta-lactamase family protein [Myxococcales bacterium]